MSKKIYTLILSALIYSAATAQLSINTGSHSLEFTFGASAYYNHRFLKEGELNQRKDRFRLRDAQLQVEGRYKNLIEYELQVDFADLASAFTGSVDPENPGLMDAYVTFKGIPFINITAGYGKVPYSRSSLVPFFATPYWQRAEFLRGDFFARRDIGATISSSLWKQRINISAGVYTGIGEIGLRGDNDPSGQPEFVGRVEFAYPSRYRHRDIDDKVSPIPMFVIGGNARYANKALPEGTVMPPFSMGEYGIKVIDGEKLGYGFDASLQYMGFSAQFEMHQFRMKPAKENSPLFRGVDKSLHKGYVLAGGYYAQLNYYSPLLRSIFSMRFEEFNINDLAPGLSRRLSPAYAFQLKGFNAMLKVQYWHILSEEESVDPLRWNDQIRVGIQYFFR